MHDTCPYLVWNQIGELGYWILLNKNIVEFKVKLVLIIRWNEERKNDVKWSVRNEEKYVALRNHCGSLTSSKVKNG